MHLSPIMQRTPHINKDNTSLFLWHIAQVYMQAQVDGDKGEEVRYNESKR